MQADPLLARLQGADAEELAAAQRAQDDTIMRLWPCFDTVEIAAYLRVAESVIANRLAKLRDARARV